MSPVEINYQISKNSGTMIQISVGIECVEKIRLRSVHYKQNYSEVFFHKNHDFSMIFLKNHLKNPIIHEIS